jgi:hypothetical protein
MVHAQAEHWRGSGAEVWADLPGWSRPPEIRGYIPDVFSQRLLGLNRVITEVETCDSLNTEHTKAQWRASSSASGVAFHVVVPRSCLGVAQRLAAVWGVRVDQWWYRDGV